MSILDSEEDIINNNEGLIKSFLQTNYRFSYDVIINCIKDGDIYVINVKRGSIYANKTIESLTNGFFRFGYVDTFDCLYCSNLESLEGAPLRCRSFYCNECNGLKNLIGAPQECDIFSCSKCINLESLEGAPKYGSIFHCDGCDALKDLCGIEETNYSLMDFYSCTNLKSLKGLPVKHKYHTFDFRNCPKLYPIIISLPLEDRKCFKF